EVRSSGPQMAQLVIYTATATNYYPAIIINIDPSTGKVRLTTFPAGGTTADETERAIRRHRQCRQYLALSRHRHGPLRRHLYWVPLTAMSDATECACGSCAPTDDPQNLPATVDAGGRPTVYSRAVAERILDLVAEGKSMRKICQDETLPSRRTVQYWLQH